MKYFPEKTSQPVPSLAVVATMVAASVGCGGVAEDVEGAVSERDPIVFGTDNRLEFGAVSDSEYLRHAQGTAALFRSDRVACGGGVCALETEPFTHANTGSDFDPLPLCTGARFKDQEQGAGCTAFLVGPDTFATAGHCFCGNHPATCGTPFGDDKCAITRVVFGFHADANGNNEVVSVPDSDVYNCVDVVAGVWKVSPTLEDWAVFKVDRVVANRSPLMVRNTGTPYPGGELLLVGHPDGLPLKIAPGGEAKDNPGFHPFNWGSSVDAFAGNSGSPVIHLTSGLVEGIHIRRPVEHYYQQNGCALPQVCNATTGCAGGSLSNWAQHTNFAHVAKAVTLPLHAALITAL